MSIKVGEVLKGKVNNIKKFGAFVELPNKQVGLLHISEVSDDYVKDISDYLKKGQRVMVKVIEVKGQEQIRLSLRKVDQAEAQKQKEQVKDKPKKVDSFEKKLSDYLQGSRLTHMELTRNMEAKRSGGKKKKKLKKDS